MRSLNIKLFIVLIIGIYSSFCLAQEVTKDKDIGVSLRMIGHQILLSSGDSTSRVLPIIKEDNRYKIQFETEFAFNPDELVSTVDKVVKDTSLALTYIVEVEDCETGDMVYSFKVDDIQKSDIIPCKNRVQPKSCYNIIMTLIEIQDANSSQLLGSNNTADGTNSDSNLMYYLLFAAIIVGVLLFFFLKKRRNNSKIDPNLIPMGEYYFDKRNTMLLIKEQRIELTSKEADLLLLLHDAANTTVEREVLLNRVWGDEGDYVGRTLDVFISKLRKKLEFDSKVKIVNTRGVGYKLVMDV